MRPPIYALVGNPNCGKTTLFNALTGLNQRVGNYPGVTVEKHEGVVYSQHGQPLTLIDLPGAYSLAARSPDEAVLRDVLLGRRADTPAPDRIVCVVDASNLERSLYLIHQVLDLGRPAILAVNMVDLAAKSGLRVRVGRLEQTLGIPVIECEATNGRGIVALKLALSRRDLPLSRHRWEVPATIASAVSELQASLIEEDGKLPLVARAEALLLLTDRDSMRVAGSRPLHPHTENILRQWQRIWASSGTDWATALVNSRRATVAQWCTELVERTAPAPTGPSVSDRLDGVVTHPVWGWCVFFGLMGAMLFSIFTLAEHPMNWIDGHMAALADWVKSSMAPGDLRDLLTDGAIGGVGGVVVFLPQILILFFFIGLLESTGYMARAAFFMDQLMGRVGLNGRAFIPLLSSYACAIPGIMATRTMEDRRERLVTILIAPLMSCSARLPVYLLLIAALVPGAQVPVLTKVGLMLLLYAVGTLGAFGFAWLFQRTLLKGEPSVLILELPPYQWPALGAVVRHMVERAWAFLKTAGTVILALSLVLWFLTAYPKAPAGTPPAQQLARSYAGQVGHAIEPAIRPLGFDWQIGLGLVTSLAAREVFVSTMSVVFNAEDATDGPTPPLRDALRRATWADGRPLFTPLVCFTLMLYYAFAMQCLSTLAVVRRETGSWKWPLFQLGYMNAAAWLLAFVVYQGGRLLGF